MTDPDKQPTFDELEPKEYIEVLKSTLEVPKYLVGLIVFFATATAAVSRLKDGQIPQGGKWLFISSMLLTFVVMVFGFRVVAHALDEMAHPFKGPERSMRYTKLLQGPYSLFVKCSLLPLLMWMICLVVIVLQQG